MLVNAQKKNIVWESTSCSTSVFRSYICLTGNFLGLAVVSKYFMATTEQLLITESHKSWSHQICWCWPIKRVPIPIRSRAAGDASARDLLYWARAKCARDSFQDTQLLFRSTSSLWRGRTPFFSQKRQGKVMQPSCWGSTETSPLKTRWVNWSSHWCQAHIQPWGVWPTLGKLGRGCNTCQEGVWRKGHQL